jgi:hypothetical protein
MFSHISIAVAMMAQVSTRQTIWRSQRFSVFLLFVVAMAPHLSLTEQDIALSALARGKAPVEIHELLRKRRSTKKIDMMNLTAVRRFLRGKTHKRGQVEARGRKRAVTRRNVMAMDNARRKFIDRTKGTRQATWDLIRVKGRTPKAHRSTVARAFIREGSM